MCAPEGRPFHTAIVLLGLSGHDRLCVYPEEWVFVNVRCDKATDEDVNVRKNTFLVSPRLRRNLARLPSIVHIRSGSSLRELFADVVNFNRYFPCSFANITLVETGIPLDSSLKTQLRCLFKMLPTISELNVTFDLGTECSNAIFKSMQCWPLSLPALRKLRLKYRPSLFQNPIVLPEFFQLPTRRSPWESEGAWKACIRQFRSLEVVQITTPFSLTDVDEHRQLEWVARWTNGMLNMARVYLCHSDERWVFLKDEDAEWEMHRWQQALQGFVGATIGRMEEDYDRYDSEPSDPEEERDVKIKITS
ncbi:hypothetical protein CPB83DRAFT_840964 [Crepidotus variabilis]|uniref:Uncharacterized protein n=1 Tax=Crepidotus variabilis TaxID=179855 RepID=A0A9P6JI33_9AGAR|nr:hypothetical protein CPB83DRAFT_840964 [Crepidotus variabilis]